MLFRSLFYLVGLLVGSCWGYSSIYSINSFGGCFYVTFKGLRCSVLETCNSLGFVFELLWLCDFRSSIVWGAGGGWWNVGFGGSLSFYFFYLIIDSACFTGVCCWISFFITWGSLDFLGFYYAAAGSSFDGFKAIDLKRFLLGLSLTVVLDSLTLGLGSARSNRSFEVDLLISSVPGLLSIIDTLVFPPLFLLVWVCDLGLTCSLANLSCTSLIASWSR